MLERRCRTNNVVFVLLVEQWIRSLSQSVWVSLQSCSRWVLVSARASLMKSISSWSHGEEGCWFCSLRTLSLLFADHVVLLASLRCGLPWLAPPSRRFLIRKRWGVLGRSYLFADLVMSLWPLWSWRRWLQKRRSLLRLLLVEKCQISGRKWIHRIWKATFCF